MRRKLFRIILFALILLGVTGYIKGCDSSEFPKQKPVSSSSRDSLDNNPDFPKDTLVLVAAGSHYEHGDIHDLIFGKHYRELWALPVNMPAFCIDTVKGGLKILHKGGSMQTLNLRLQSKDGHEYVIRTVDKDNANALPPFFRSKILNFIIRDQTSALNPYSALIIPPLAHAAGLYHTRPQLYFIPYDPKFGKYKDEFEGRVVLLEEQVNSSWQNSPLFGNPDDIVSTKCMLENKFENQDVYIDQKEYAKARIFDLWINDWDRHADQWRWAEFYEEDKILYKPIPRDRDMAFFKFDKGILPGIVRMINPKFQSFQYDYGNIKGMIKNARIVDHFILTNISKKDFLNIARKLQHDLSDSVIAYAIASWPEEVYKEAGVETMSKLLTRRKNLVKAAEKYYDILFKEVKITGTDEEETFLVERLNNQETAVTILNKKGKNIFHHIYSHEVTKEVCLYGLKGDDRFIIKGETEKGIVVKVYGGEGKDKVSDKSFVRGYNRKTKVIDTETGNDIEFGPETENMTSSDPRILYFDRSGEK